MRTKLKELHMKTRIFRARFVLKSVGGDVLLRHVLGPESQYVTQHLWVRAGHWHATHHEPGDTVAIRARSEPYTRDDGSKDWSLFHCREWWP